jgi:RimJ/RimL family protein N-acetyltransferase
VNDWKLETDRLILREMMPADLDDVAAILIDEEVTRVWTTRFTRDDCAAWINRQRARYENDDCGYWLCVDRATGDVVGQAGVLLLTIDGRTEPSLGWITGAAHRGRGYATEAARASLGWALDHTDAPRVLAPIRPINAPSIRVAERLGMRHAWTTTHADLEHLIYAITRKETGTLRT